MSNSLWEHFKGVRLDSRQTYQEPMAEWTRPLPTRFAAGGDSMERTMATACIAKRDWRYKFMEASGLWRVRRLWFVHVVLPRMKREAKRHYPGQFVRAEDVK